MDGDFPLEQPHTSRVYDYFLGGKDNYEVDRQAAEEILKAWPDIRTAARVNRQFMQRSTRFLAEAGIRQFLDIGTGIPTEPNLHQIAREVAPESRVVYVDNDPVVLAHARALMPSSASGAMTYIDGDVTVPSSVLLAPELTETLDLSEPVGLSMIALLHFVEDDVPQIISTFLDALAPGSHLVICTITADFAPEQVQAAQDVYRVRKLPAQVRTYDEVSRWFDGLELVEPGVVPPHRWRLGDAAEFGPSFDAKVSCWCGVARKP
ncbi:SAM-dependent methyltransferase [Nocardia huaxiensis]|uniref:SAM-dependent methyltransferase n=1 Tax=Nocardia huaxiensis TaxID=2755382 RepID=A0A7D6ZEC1_9NOCA|nr:SAM-dependent methyltransferase [Nocardia huaxiensis]QLY28147.1 SAM-dependent methyltransferase [Nocardia huaxiensis]UFS98406.1 SAM-dependent methyltransferase [Nocardia huaxiensis]